MFFVHFLEFILNPGKKPEGFFLGKRGDITL